MKNLSIITIALLYCCQAAFAQMNPLKGSGKLVNKNFNFTNFSQIRLADLDGEVAIIAGQSFSIAITIDDNLEPLLAVKESNGKLTVAFEDNRNNKRYVEESNVRITITLPTLLFLENDGNANVTGIAGASFAIQNLANGNATLLGMVNNIEIRKTGNGNVNAKALIAENVTVKASGNGNILVNASTYFMASGSGNGDVINTGAALPAAGAALGGNGEVKTVKNKS